MEIDTCINCKEGPIYVKKRKLCSKCYVSIRNKTGPFLKTAISSGFSSGHQVKRELEFIRNFFDHSNWIYQPCTFKLNSDKYTPDFYDGVRHAFIEVSGSRQAYHSNKNKYDLLRKIHKNLMLNSAL